MTNEWAATLADAFSAGVTPVEQRVYAAVLGDEHPSELNTYSCLTRDELARMTTWLAGAGPGPLVDLGCGRGGRGVIGDAIAPRSTGTALKPMGRPYAKSGGRELDGRTWDELPG